MIRPCQCRLPAMTGSCRRRIDSVRNAIAQVHAARTAAIESGRQQVYLEGITQAAAMRACQRRRWACDSSKAGAPVCRPEPDTRDDIAERPVFGLDLSWHTRTACRVALLPFHAD